MISVIKENEVITNGISEVTTFKMKQTGAALRILSDLYSDKPLAIVRELGCNAADSMTASGKADQPFHIHLPNTIEPWLTIQDFGTGISHENIYNIYATYFESTKTNTNDQIGCLGLGSKSPFCYADNFTVTSIFNGVKSSYNAYLNAQSTPTIAFMGSAATDEANGIAIQIPIKSQDFQKFINAVKKSFRFFKTKPTISGGEIIWNEKAPSMTGEGWEYYTGFEYGENYAVMGGVAYPIDSYKLSYDYNRFLTKGGLVVYVNMGELDFVPSREALSYCENTVNTLNAKIGAVTTEIPKIISSSVEQQDTLFNALKLVGDIRSNMWAYLPSNTTFTWKGLDITDNESFVSKLSPDSNRYSHTSRYRRGGSRSSVVVNKYPSIKEGTWYVDDLKRGAINRVKEYVKNNVDSTINLFSQSDKTSLIAAGFEETLFTNVSTLPAVVTQRKYNSVGKTGGAVVKQKGDIKVFVMGVQHNTAWDSAIIKPTDSIPKFYMVKQSDYSFNVKLGEGLSNINGSKGDLGRLCSFLKVATTDIVMVKENDVKKLQSAGSQNLQEYVDANFSSLTDRLEDYFNANIYSHEAIERLQKTEDYISLADDNVFKVEVEKIYAIKKELKHYRFISGFSDKHYNNDKYKKANFNKFDCKALNFLFQHLCDSYADVNQLACLVKTITEK